MSNSLRPHKPQHNRPPCPSPTPGVHPNPCPSSQWCHPTISSSVIPFSSCPQSFPASGSFPCEESALHIRWPKYWSFSFNISPSNEHPGLISFRMDWLDLLAVQGTLKSLLQHHSSEASILQCSAFFIVQLSHPYMTTGKTIALTRRTFVGKVMSLLFNMLSRLVITKETKKPHLLGQKTNPKFLPFPWVFVACNDFWLQAVRLPVTWPCRNCTSFGTVRFLVSKQQKPT